METPAKKPTNAESQPPPLNDAQCHLVLVVDLAYARRHGLQGEDGEDQALEFLLHLLLRLRDHPQTDLSLTLSAAWLARSADNWIRSFLRIQRRRQYRELAWLPVVSGSGEVISLELPSKEPLPCTQAIRAEFCQRIRSAIAKAQFYRCAVRTLHSGVGRRAGGRYCPPLTTAS